MPSTPTASPSTNDDASLQKLDTAIGRLKDAPKGKKKKLRARIIAQSIRTMASGTEESAVAIARKLVEVLGNDNDNDGDDNN